MKPIYTTQLPRDQSILPRRQFINRLIQRRQITFLKQLLVIRTAQLEVPTPNPHLIKRRLRQINLKKLIIELLIEFLLPPPLFLPTLPIKNITGRLSILAQIPGRYILMQNSHTFRNMQNRRIWTPKPDKIKIRPSFHL